jgi:fructose-1-phosphate kinase PfkB-like protein
LGAVASSAGGTHVVTPSQTGTYAVGSGDCFMAGLVSRLEEGDQLGDALHVAGHIATANSLVPGAALY